MKLHIDQLLLKRIILFPICLVWDVFFLLLTYTYEVCKHVDKLGDDWMDKNL